LGLKRSSFFVHRTTKDADVRAVRLWPVGPTVGGVHRPISPEIKRGNSSTGTLQAAALCGKTKPYPAEMPRRNVGSFSDTTGVPL
jgi:hypothetical protein